MSEFEIVATRTADAAARVRESVGAAPIDQLDDDAVMALIARATEVRNGADILIATAAALVERRSSRDRGLDGAARRFGHRTATSLVQNITGQSKADVARTLRTGNDLLGDGWGGAAGVGTADTVGGADGAGRGASTDAAGDVVVASGPRWVALLRDAVLAGRISQAQHRAIRFGLGEPPVQRYPDTEPAVLVEAWARATERLLDEAPHCPVEELRNAARIARDRLDPVGVTLRFEERYQARSFRRWTDENGQQHARFVLDDESAAWVDSILSAALRPRRGPRFVGEDAADTTAEAAADTRTTEQLQFDTVMAVLRTGAAADSTQAFGDRQPGVRIVVEATAVTTTGDGHRRVAGVGHLEDGGHALPGGVVEKYLCDAGSRTVTIDASGRPLDVGREQRLFGAKARVAIAVRDGGCIRTGCSAPPSWTEIHHIDHWQEHHGKTDVDDGVPLCRFDHLDLHNRGGRIRRVRDPDTGTDTYWLHLPPDPGHRCDATTRTPPITIPPPIRSSLTDALWG